MKKFSLGFSTNWKSFISPTIVATLILIVTLYLFGAQNSMIAPFVTISYLHFINMKNHYACMVRQLLLYLLIAAASYIAVISLPLCILVNAGMLFLLAFLVTDEYHPTNYEPMGMALIFFQTATLSTPKALGERLLAILVSFGIILLFVAVTGARYGKKDPIRDLVLQGFGICEQLVQICETDTLDKNMTSCNMNTHSPNQHADVHTTSTANEYSNTYNTDFLKKVSAINTDRPTSSEKERLTQQIIDLNHQISDEIYSYNRSTFRRKGKVNFYCSFVVMFQVVNYMLANTQVPGNLDKAKNLLRNYRALLDVENPKNDYWMLLLRSDRLDLHDFKFRFAMREVIVMTPVLALAWISQQQFVYWMAFSLFFMLVPTTDYTLDVVRKRVLGTVIGIFISLILFMIFPDLPGRVVITAILNLFIYANEGVIPTVAYISCATLAMQTVDLATISNLTHCAIVTFASAAIALLANRFLFPTHVEKQIQRLSGRLSDIRHILVDYIFSQNLEKQQQKIHSNYVITDRFLNSEDHRHHFNDQLVIRSYLVCQRIKELDLSRPLEHRDPSLPVRERRHMFFMAEYLNSEHQR